MVYNFSEIENSPILSEHLNLGGTSPEGGSITLNSKYLLRDNKPYIPVMGEIHHQRVNPSDWGEEIAKMKAGGITLISTYLLWIYVEEIEGEFDFSGRNDIRAFVEECAEQGLDVVIRIGPWAHGECINGGFPEWLIKKNFPLRDNNSEYLFYAKRLYSKISEQVKGLLYKDGGKIIMIQLENELVDNADHIRTLKELALETGLVVPIYTVTGWNSADGAQIPEDEVMPLFGGYPEAPWETHIEQLPPSPHFFFNTMRNDTAIGSDLIPHIAEEGGLPYEKYPFATCELGGGVQISYHRRPRISAMDVYAISLIKLGCGNNLPGYYMYHGGINSIGKLSGFNEEDCPILTYDFQAPIGEYGQMRMHYRLLRLLHLFIIEFEEIFSRLDTSMQEHMVNRNDTGSLRYAARHDGKKGFVFVNNYQRLSTLNAHEDVIFELNGKQFPANGMNVIDGMAFFIPFGLELGAITLDYATTQPLCRADDSTWVFMQIGENSCEYAIDGTVLSAKPGKDYCIDAGGIKIITLTQEEALYTVKINNRLYVGDGCDIYFYQGKLVSSGGNTYYEWNGNGFTKKKIDNQPAVPAMVSYVETETPDFERPFEYELNPEGKSNVKWWKISVDGKDGFVNMHYCGDVIQLYADGKLLNDHFYDGSIWSIPSALLAGREIYAAVSELRGGTYLEVIPENNLSISKITWSETAEY